MSIGTSEAVLEIFSGTAPQILSSDTSFSNRDSIFPSRLGVKCIKRKSSRYMQLLKCSSVLRTHICSLNDHMFRDVTISRLQHLCCKCQQADSVGHGGRFVDSAEKLNLNSPNVLKYESVPLLKEEKNGYGTSTGNGKDKIHNKDTVDSVEDQAWEKLRESMVYYCGSPIGTIAANDPTCSNALNYDQVFIRDFIPSEF